MRAPLGLRLDLEVEHVGDDVEVGAAARRDDELVVGGDPPHRLVQLEQVGEVVPHGDHGGRGAVVAEAALVAGDAGESQGRGVGDPPRERLGLVEGAGAGASARRPELDEHVDRSGQRGPGCREPAFHRLDGRDRVDPRDEREVGVGELGRDERERGRCDERVREHDARDAEGAGGAHLAGRREREPGRAGVELQAPERGRHRGLAVRHELHAVRGGPRLDRRGVPAQRLGVEHGERGPELLEPGRGGEELPHGEAVGPLGQPGVARGEHLIREVVDSAGHPSSSQLVQRVAYAATRLHGICTPASIGGVTQPPEVLAVGETMVLVAPALAEPLETATDFHLDPGGAEANVASHLAALGRRAAWAGLVGDDALGRRLVAQLAARGVDTTWVDADAERADGRVLQGSGPRRALLPARLRRLAHGSRLRGTAPDRRRRGSCTSPASPRRSRPRATAWSTRCSTRPAPPASPSAST